MDGLQEAGVYKIDSEVTDGLTGVSNSLAYRVHEIEKHFHSREVWYGRHSSVDAGVNEGEGWSVTPFQSTSGTTGVFGSWIPVLGTGDTPFKGGYAKFDLHRLLVTDTNASKKPHLIQITWDDTAAADGLTDGNYTGLWLTPEKDGKAEPSDIQCSRITAGLKVWVRHLVVGDNTKTMDFVFGIHEYAG